MLLKWFYPQFVHTKVGVLIYLFRSSDIKWKMLFYDATNTHKADIKESLLRYSIIVNFTDRKMVYYEKDLSTE